MTNFPVHTIESAPERSKPALQQLQSAFGMIPNIIGAMSTSPVLINSLVGLFGNVHGGSFTEAQVQTVLLTDAVTNACTWAVAFHTALALKEGIDPADVQAIREGRLPKDSKLAALSALAKTMIEKRGRLDDEDVDRFIAAGFGKDHAPRGHRRRRRVHDHELHRQHHEDASRSAVSGSRLGRLRARGACSAILSTGAVHRAGRLCSLSRIAERCRADPVASSSLSPHAEPAHLVLTPPTQTPFFGRQ